MFSFGQQSNSGPVNFATNKAILDNLAKEKVKSFNYNLSDKPNLSKSNPFFMPPKPSVIPEEEQTPEAAVSENPLDSATTLKKVSQILKKDEEQEKPFSIFNLKGNSKARERML